MRLLLLFNLIILSGCSIYSARGANTLKSNQYVDKAVGYLKQARINLAETSIELAAHYDRNNPAVADARGCLAFARGEFEKAEVFFVDAIDRAPNYYRAYYNLAQLKLFNNQPYTAQEIMQVALDANPDELEYRKFYQKLLKLNNASKTDIVKEQEYLEVIKSG